MATEQPEDLSTTTVAELTDKPTKPLAPAQPQISKKEAIRNWMAFDMSVEVAEALAVNNFVRPTEVQIQSLNYLNNHVDMVVAAKTGQGKTLVFGIPIMDLLVKRLTKEGLNEEKEFSSIKALIMSPTRELALQIKDHLSAIVPIQYQSKIKVCPIVGGMSVQKQERLLSYEPTILIATPGRLWELINDKNNPYLVSSLPLIDVLVLDEADRMIEDGHFKEMRLILDFIYTKRVEYKKQTMAGLSRVKAPAENNDDEETKELRQKKKAILKKSSNKKDFYVKDLEKAGDIDYSKVVDLVDEDGILEGMDEDDLVIENLKEETKEDKHLKRKQNKVIRQGKEAMSKEQELAFAKEYKKMGGIQHIICSATMTIDGKGRITPKKAKKIKKLGHSERDKLKAVDTMALLCETLRFRSKTPKVIDLTEEGERMPETLIEKAIRCKKEERDLYTYYYLMQNGGEPTIIFCNSITCVKRLTHLLDFLKIRNQCLHSKMQQRQRIKNLERFKRAVQQREAGNFTDGAVLVCTDVAARGLDIPYVSRVLHYQCPFNAEIYIHRCGRTARIGREGECLALLAPEDEKTFTELRKIVKRSDPDQDLQMYQVSYTQLSKLE